MSNRATTPDAAAEAPPATSLIARRPFVRDALNGKRAVGGFRSPWLYLTRGDPGQLAVCNQWSDQTRQHKHGGKEVVLHYVGEGEIFGEIAALDAKERAADAVALEECQIFFLYTRDLLPTLTAHPPVMLEVLRGLCEKICAAATIIEDNKLAMRWRTARGLLRLARQHGRLARAGGSLQLAISQQELGKYLGAYRTNVNRQLGELKSAKLITISGTEITIVDAEGTRRNCRQSAIARPRACAVRPTIYVLGCEVVQTRTPRPALGIRLYCGSSGLARSGNGMFTLCGDRHPVL